MPQSVKTVADPGEEQTRSPMKIFFLVSTLQKSIWFELPPTNIVCEGYVFTSVCLSVMGGSPGLQAHTRGGADWGGEGLQAHTQGGFQAHTQQAQAWGGYPSMHWGRHPSSRRLLLWAVRILLECILVSVWIHWKSFWFHVHTFIRIKLTFS